MFSSKSTTAVPKRNPFSLTRAQIIKDIEAISTSEEHRNQLYTCLDDKLPKDKKFAEIEDFLKDSQQLEEIKQMLQDQVAILKGYEKDLTNRIDDVEGKVKAACQ